MLKLQIVLSYYLITTFSVSSSLSTMALTTYKPLGHPKVDTDVERFIDVRVVINSPVVTCFHHNEMYNQHSQL